MSFILEQALFHEQINWNPLLVLSENGKCENQNNLITFSIPNLC